MKKNIILTDANSSGVSTTPDMLDITLNNVTTSGNYIFSHNGTSFLPNYSTPELARNIYDKYGQKFLLYVIEHQHDNSDLDDVYKKWVINEVLNEEN